MVDLSAHETVHFEQVIIDIQNIAGYTKFIVILIKKGGGQR